MTSCRTSRSATVADSGGTYCGMPVEQGDDVALLQELDGWIGTPYRYGGNSRKGTDCSGMVQSVYLKLYGIKLYRSCDDICKKNCRKIGKDDLRQGDLVFFRPGGRKKKISHVGIYLKNGRFVHASSSRGVMVSSLDEEYYRRNFHQAGRVKGR